MDNDYKTNISLVEKLIEKINLEEAKKILDSMVIEYKNSSEVWDLYSEVLLGLDKTKEAKKSLETSIKLEPNSNGDKYMSLGQLLDDPRKKLEMFEKAIIIYRKNELNEEIRNVLSSALASIAELYMSTYLCDDKNAEEKCENYLQEAYKLSPNNPDVLIQYSNLRILRSRDKEAMEFMKKAFNIINQNEKDETFPDCDIISNLARNFSELNDFSKAIILLEIITALDQDNLEYWYLLAFNHFKVKNYLHSWNCLEKISEIVKINNEKDDEIIEACKELENELKKIEEKGELTNNLFENDQNKDDYIGNFDNKNDTTDTSEDIIIGKKNDKKKNNKMEIDD